MRPRLLAALLSGWFLLAAVPAHASRTLSLHPLPHGLWTVAVESPGAGTTWHLLVDTGSTHTVLSIEAARRAGLDVRPGPSLATPAGVVEVGAALLPDFHIGERSLGPFQVLVADLSALDRSPRLDGILGMDVLGAGPVRIDLVVGALAFLDDARVPRGSGAEVPAREQAGRLVIDARIDGRRRAMVLDTGAQMAVMFDAAATGAPATLATVGGRRGAVIVRAEMALGGVVLGAVPTARVAPPPARHGSDGLLPASAFASVYIDRARGLVHVVPRRWR